MRNIVLILSILCFPLLPGESSAVCKNSILNPVNDICWNCIFPVKIGGKTIKSSDIDSPIETNTSVLCLCNKVLGVPVSFREPARMVDTVKDPYCMVPLGTSLSNPKQGFLGGTNSEQNASSADQNYTFQQAHWYLLGIWNLLDLFADLPCLDAEEFDVAYLTEIDPLWNDSILTLMINPEAILFANPVAQIACAADSVAANASTPLDALFWCEGSWGSAYPLGGSVSSSNYTQANATLAARMIYKLGREGLLWDTGINECGKVYTPIWKKSNYCIGAAKPVKDKGCQPIGRSSLIWGAGKNPPYSAGGNSSDNFLWIIYRMKKCCAGYSLF